MHDVFILFIWIIKYLSSHILLLLKPDVTYINSDALYDRMIELYDLFKCIIWAM